jgi:heme exporter protein C
MTIATTRFEAPHGPAAAVGTDRLAERALRPLAALLGVCAAVTAVLILRAPMDSVQGVVQKILYVHPPCAFAAYLGFFTTAIAGALYLWRREERHDRLAASAAEVGVLFCTLMIVTGPIWAKATWGRWWSWDARLTLTLLLWFVYAAYLLLRNFTEGSERIARLAAVYGMLGLVVIPLNYFAIELSGGRAVHPENLERGSLGEGMGAPFAMGTLTILVAFAYLLALRIDVGRLRMAALDAAAEEIA